MQYLEKKIRELEEQVDRLSEEKFLLEQDLRKEGHLRAEMQEFLGNIYDSCKGILEEEGSKLGASDLAKNLLQNIRDFAESYKISL